MGGDGRMLRPCQLASPIRYFNSAREVIRQVVLMYVRFLLSLRNVEDLLFKHGIDNCCETVRLPRRPLHRFRTPAVAMVWLQ